MDRIPSELFHRICAALEPEDVLSFRLLDRRCAAIGLEYLFPNGQVDFYLSKSGLSHLDDIANHPELRERVEILQYEGHTLDPQRKSFKRWKKSASNEYMTHVLFRHRSSKLKLSTSTNWRRHYNIYVGKLREQTEILEQAQDLLTLANFFGKCPNLRTLVFSNGYCFHNYRRIHDPFEATLEMPYSHLEPMGMRQLAMAMIALAWSLAKITKLKAGIISWKFFSNNDPFTWDMISSACSSLTHLRLELTTGMTDDVVGVEVAECRRQLETNGSVRKFLGRIPNLEVLELTFDFMNEDPERLLFDPTYPADLKDIIPDRHVWARLHTLKLGCFETLQDNLLSFLDNHKSTLKSLILVDVALNLKWNDDQTAEGGSWMELLPHIRNTLQLDYGCLHGEVSAYGAHGEGDEEWHINHEDVPGDEDWWEEIVDYLTRKTDICPLRKDNMHFM